ncbi:MAG TPA: hypothetical protein VFR48_05290 [Solirubrobacteraceae bacterium]|nr:hypothetical protein [Solirubrobacteraceae bacterium]
MFRAATVSLAAIAVSLAIASPGHSAVTFGDGLGVPNAAIVPYSCGRHCTLATTTSPEHLPQFRAPIAGTILRWRIEAGSDSTTQKLSLRVLAPKDNGRFAGAGTSASTPLPAGAGTFSFATRLPVRAGDFIGVNSQGGALDAMAVEEESISVFAPPPIDFGAAVLGVHQNFALLVNADIAKPPTSSALPGCRTSGDLLVRVTVDSDPSVAPSALHVRIDGGTWKVVRLHGRSGTARIALRSGRHTLSYWGQDSLGQRESHHHRIRATVAGHRVCV